MDSPLTTDQILIEKCKELIEKQLPWGSSDSWKQRDFETLSKRIYHKTNVLLSLSTLKRIWKKKPQSTPHPSTLNALAQFLEFADWYDFKEQHAGDTLIESHSQNSIHPKNDQVKAKLGGKAIPKSALITTLFLIICGLSINYIHGLKTKSNLEYISFNSKKAVSSGVPNTAIFNYDISMVETDSVFFQQSWDESKRVHLNKSDTHYTTVYYFPGYHKAKLLVDNAVVKEHPIHVTTDGWLGLVPDVGNPMIPIYLQKGHIHRNGFLYTSPEDLTSYRIDVSKRNYWITFYHVADFGDIDGDHFTLHARLKNSLDEGGLVGQYGIITIMCENGRILLPLSIPGCVGNISLKFMEKWIHGRNNDLSMFGCDMSQWNEIQCHIQDRRVQISLNNHIIYNTEYQNPAGGVMGVNFRFFGCGAVDHVRLMDGNNRIAFEDQF